MRYIVDNTIPEDLDDVAANLIDEAKAVYDALGMDPLEAMTQAYQMSNIKSIVMVADDGDMEVLGVFGWWHMGYIWMSLTPEFSNHAHHFARQMRIWADALVEHLHGCHMYIDADNPKHVRFAEFLGFHPVEQFQFSPELSFTTYARST